MAKSIIQPGSAGTKKAKKKEGKKQRKFGRNAIWCASYKARGQREKNKKVKLAKHIARHPNDLVSANVKV